MKCARLAILFFFQALFSANYTLASVVYEFSGYIDYVQDYNSYSLGVVGESPVYPSGIGSGTPFSVSLSLSGNLVNATGLITFDIGGIYQGQVNVSGGGYFCNTNSCASGASYYNDSAFTRLSFLQVSGGSSSPTTTNLPLSDLGGGYWQADVSFSFAQNTNKPLLDTPLHELPIDEIYFSLGSFYQGVFELPCPTCPSSDPTPLDVAQGWYLGSTSTDLNVVPVPAAFWLMGSGLIGLVGIARRRNK